MRFIIYGVGAIGGTLAAKLALAGETVVGIARGAQLDAIRRGGLVLRTPTGAESVSFPCHAAPSEITFTDADVIFLTVKSQDTAAALDALRDAGVTTQPVVCAQNGVANERAALRLFPNVYAMLVVMPATFVRPGEVAAFGAPHSGMFDIGRFPDGSDKIVDTLVEALCKAGFAAFATDNAMASKYGKLLMNLGNVLDAAVGDVSAGSALVKAARAEGEAVMRAAGIAFGSAGGEDDARRKALMQSQPVAGADRVGSSSAQSLARGTGSIETDYLNGEIVLLGRLHDVPVPVNTALVALGRRLIAERRAPGSMTLTEIEATIG